MIGQIFLQFFPSHLRQLPLNFKNYFESKQKVIHETNDSTKRIIWWRARCVDLDCRNQAIFEFEIFRDGIEMEFVSIELIINQFSNNERKRG